MRTPKRTVRTDGEVVYIVRYRRDGKQRTLTARGPNAEKEATEFARLIDALGVDRAVSWWNAHLDDEAVRTGLTMDDWWTRYLKSVTGITDGTRITYQRTYARVWAKPLGAKPLPTIVREDIASVVNELSAHRSDKTVRNAYGVISSCFKVAVRDGHLPASPCNGIRLPRRTEHEAAEMRFLTHDEWLRLYDELPVHYRPLFTFLIGTGARWGEAAALNVSDIVISPSSAPVVRITKAVKWDASRASRDVGPTKTRKSRRTVTLPPEVTAELDPLLDRPGSARLFLAPRGGELRHRTVYDDWKRSVTAAGLEPQPRIHDLRHSHVAWLIAADVPLPVIQARLGHEHISTTIDRYGHLLPDLQLAAANAASVAMRARPALNAAPEPPT